MFGITLRSIVLICEVAAIVFPLLKKGRRQKLPFVLKESVLFALANWDVIRKYVQKRQISNVIKALRNSFRFKN